MTQQRTGWHHCGKCGEVYQAALGELCPDCARTPIATKKRVNVHTHDSSLPPARKEFNAKRQSENPSAVKLVQMNPKSLDTDADGNPSRKSSERKRKSNHMLLKFVVGWVISLGLIAGLIRWKYNPSTPATPTTTDAPVDSEQLTLKSQNLDLIAQANSGIIETTNEFFQQSTPESIAQLCRRRPNLSMTIFNDGPKTIFFKPESVELEAYNVIRPNGITMIEALWRDQRGRKMEMVYAKEDDRWVIDWESYAKSSTLPWSIFQGGETEEVGTFRMLVRERLADQNFNNLDMSIALYEPGFLHGSPMGLTTPEFLVNRQSRNGRMITAALEARNNHQPLFGSIFPEADPANMARVCVKIRRSMKDDKKVFELVEVIACHWMGIDDPGVNLTDTP